MSKIYGAYRENGSPLPREGVVHFCGYFGMSIFQMIDDPHSEEFVILGRRKNGHDLIVAEMLAASDEQIQLAEKGMV